jgi:FkbM family methyltransferase
MQEGSVQTITTAYGRFTVDMHRDRKIGASLQSGHYHQQDMLLFLEKCVSKEDIVVDIGAHIGTLTIPLATWAKQVIAFEPAPASFALLEQNARQNNLIIDARNMGLARTAGHASLVEKNTMNAGAQTLKEGEGSVAISTLDAQILEADVLKIDVEGMELEVLLGGKRLIAQSRPMIVCEINLSQLRSHKASPQQLAQFFHSQNYRLYMLMHSRNDMSLGRVSSLGLLAALIAPRAWALHTGSAPFDIIAIPAEKSLPFTTKSFGSVMARVIGENIAQKIRRARAYIGI